MSGRWTTLVLPCKTSRSAQMDDPQAARPSLVAVDDGSWTCDAAVLRQLSRLLNCSHEDDDDEEGDGGASVLVEPGGDGFFFLFLLFLSRRSSVW